MSTHPYSEARVAVLLGGRSSERAVSLVSGRMVAAALRRCGHDVVEIDVGADLVDALRASSAQVCFNALHGTFGEDGCVQGLLEMLGLPYTGSGPLGSALAFDKERSKALFRQAGLPTPDFQVLYESPQIGRGASSPFGYPVVVKPPAEGSSVGITIVEAPDEYEGALARAASCGDGRVMIERFVEGTEVTVGLLEGEVLGTTEIVPGDRFYDYQAKYESDATRYHSPARLPAPALRRLGELASLAAAVLACGGAPRVDFLVDRAGSPWLLEVNTLPGMTDHSLLPMCAANVGIGYDELCDRILAAARLWVAQEEG